MKTTSQRVCLLVSVCSLLASVAPAQDWQKLNAPLGRMTDVLSTGGKTIYLSTTEGIWTSTDGGFHWSRQNAGLGSTSVHALARSGRTVFAGTSRGVYRLQDGERKWTRTSLPDSGYRTLLAAANGFVFARANGAELYRSENGGIDWTRLDVGNALNNPEKFRNAYEILINDEGHLIFEFDSCSIAQSTNYGTTWTRRMALWPGGGSPMRIALRGSLILMASWQGGLVCSRDYGATWKKIETPPGHAGNVAIGPGGMFYFDTYDPDRQYVSTDTGRTWRSSSTSLTFDSFSVISGDTILGIGRADFDGRVLARSTDGGKRWKPIASAFEEPSVIAASPGGILYAATDQCGAFRSSDFGITWEPVIRASSLDHIAFAGDSAVAISGSISGVFTSTDGGRTWSDAQDHGLPERAVSALAATTRGVLYAGTDGDFVIRPDGGLSTEQVGGALWRSIDLGISWAKVVLDTSVKTTDGGKTWTQYNDEGRATGINIGWRPSYAVSSIGIDLHGNPLVESRAGYKNGWFTSTDDGVTWKRRFDVQDPMLMDFVRTDKGEIFAGVYRSTDGGTTFSSVVNGLASGGLEPVHPIPGGDVLIAASNGIFYLPYRGNTWYCVGFDSVNIESLCLSGGYLFASVRYAFEDPRNGLYRTEIRNLQKRVPKKHLVETVWQEVGRAFERPLSLFTVDRSGVMWAADHEAGLARSSDGGKSWTRGELPDDYVHGFVVHPKTGSLLVGTYKGLFESTTSGRSWKEIPFNLREDESGGPSVHAILVTKDGKIIVAAKEWPPLSSYKVDSARVSISYGIVRNDSSGRIYRQGSDAGVWIASATRFRERATLLFESAKGTLFVAVDGEGLCRSTDGGLTWASANKGLLPEGAFYICSYSAEFDRSVKCMASDGRGTLFAVRGGGLLYKSTDDGTTWNVVGGASSWTLSLCVDESGDMFAGTALGVFRSTDEGKSWQSFSAGLTARSVQHVAMHPSGHLVAATGDGRVFMSIRKFGSGSKPRK